MELDHKWLHEPPLVSIYWGLTMQWAVLGAAGLYSRGRHGMLEGTWRLASREGHWITPAEHYYVMVSLDKRNSMWAREGVRSVARRQSEDEDRHSGKMKEIQSVRHWAWFAGDTTIWSARTTGRRVRHLLEEVCGDVRPFMLSLEARWNRTRATVGADTFANVEREGKFLWRASTFLHELEGRLILPGSGGQAQGVKLEEKEGPCKPPRPVAIVANGKGQDRLQEGGPPGRCWTPKMGGNAAVSFRKKSSLAPNWLVGFTEWQWLSWQVAFRAFGLGSQVQLC